MRTKKVQPFLHFFLMLNIKTKELIALYERRMSVWVVSN